MSFAHFTRPDGLTVPIKTEDVAEIRPATDGVDPPGARAVIVLENGQTQAVKEAVSEVEEKCK